jgi:hypothetical protein
MTVVEMEGSPAGADIRRLWEQVKETIDRARPEAPVGSSGS